jgi:hypothetical protein
MLSLMQYLGELVHAQLEDKKPEEVPDSIRLEELMQIAHRNHMDYLILGALLKTDLNEQEKLNIRPYVIKSTVCTLAQVRCLKELEDRFEAEGIYHMVLKGSVLKLLYPSPQMREMGDIDVMIYDVTLNRSKKVVEDLGFTLLKSVKHHDIYIKPPYLVIELHNALYDKNVDKNQHEYFQVKKNMTAKAGKKYALQFVIEDFYVYLIAHMAKHFYETGCGIRNLLDVYYYRLLYQATWNDTKIKKELHRCGLTEFEKRIHTLAMVWLGGQSSDSFSEALFDYMLDCGIYGKGENGVWGQFAKQNQDRNLNYKAYAKRWYYFPPLSYMENDYPWLKKSPYLIIAAWGIRAMHGLINKEGREKRKMLVNIKSNDICTINDIYKGMQLNFKK